MVPHDCTLVTFCDKQYFVHPKQLFMAGMMLLEQQEAELHLCEAYVTFLEQAAKRLQLLWRKTRASSVLSNLDSPLLYITC